MRKILLLLAASALQLSAAHAQTERGTKLLGVSVGQLHYSRSKSPDPASELHMALTPTAGYFVADNLVLGGGIPVMYSRQPAYFTSGYARLFAYGLAPMLRYYVPSSGRHRIFAELGGEYSQVRYQNNYTDPLSSGPPSVAWRTATTYGYHGALGYSFFLVPTAALEATAGYYRVAHDPINQPRNVWDVRLGFSVYLPAQGAAQN